MLEELPQRSQRAQRWAIPISVISVASVANSYSYLCEKIIIVKFLLPVQPLASVTIIVKLKVPSADGLPEIKPLLALSVRPLGNEPETTWKVNGATPPTALSVWL